MRRHPLLVLVASACVAAIAAAGRAQPPRAVTAESGYGIQDQQISVLGPESMLPTHSTDIEWNTVAGLRRAWRDAAGPFPSLRGSIDALIPNGARLESMCFYGYDDDPWTDFDVTLVRDVVNSQTGHFPAEQTLVTITTDGDSGNGVWCDNNLDLPIIYRYDADNNGDVQAISYSVVWQTNALQDHQGFRMVRFAWRREVSPAPDTATFIDVPVNTGYHRWVEATVASGIMNQCAPGRFCPNAPVTRGQLAYFLSRALGLHWPAFGVEYVP